MTGLHAPTGDLFIAGARRYGQGGEVYAENPATGEVLEPAFGSATSDDVAEALHAAKGASPTFGRSSPAHRAALLRAIADGLDAQVDPLVARAQSETGLPEGRLRGEVARTSGQLRMFADLVDAGADGRRLDAALPDRLPAPRAEIRQRSVPLGPVVVFGASNFPFAFSNAGGDTAAALAAGCPVIVKVHHAHLGVADLVSQIVTQAVREQGLPGGVYQALVGSGRTVGTALVAAPEVRAVGFTGSRTGGLALVATAQARPVPIPVYAEMSSINPVVVLRSAATAERGRAFVGSFTLGSGQFCTNPGLILVPSGAAGDVFVDAAVHEVQRSVGQTMLTAGIYRAFCDARRHIAARARLRATGIEGEGLNAPAPTLFEVTGEELITDAELATEVFGASALVVRYTDDIELHRLLGELEGQLTATVHIDTDSADEDELRLAGDVLGTLEGIAGRVIVNGWPTGVEVNYAQVHGGPFPATSDGRSTSVGARAIERFQRPVAYQSVPGVLLPKPLTDAALRTVTHLRDGRMTPAENS